MIVDVCKCNSCRMSFKQIQYDSMKCQTIATAALLPGRHENIEWCHASCEASERSLSLSCWRRETTWLGKRVSVNNKLWPSEMFIYLYMYVCVCRILHPSLYTYFCVWYIKMMEDSISCGSFLCFFTCSFFGQRRAQAGLCSCKGDLGLKIQNVRSFTAQSVTHLAATRLPSGKVGKGCCMQPSPSPTWLPFWGLFFIHIITIARVLLILIFATSLSSRSNHHCLSLYKPLLPSSSSSSSSSCETETKTRESEAKTFESARDWIQVKWDSDILSLKAQFEDAASEYWPLNQSCDTLK